MSPAATKQRFEILQEDENASIITITGRKSGPPSKRITLERVDKRIQSGLIIRHDKKHGPREFQTCRINHLRSMNQIRLHTTEVLFPGDYELKLSLRS